MKMEYATAAAGAMCVIDWKSTCGSPIECSRRWSKRRGASGAASMDPPSSASLRFSHEPGAPRLQWPPFPGVCPSGQRERAVNPSAQPTEVRILPPPPRVPGRAAYGQQAVPPSTVLLPYAEPAKRQEPAALSPGLFPAGLAGDAPHRAPAVLRPDDEQRSAAK